MKKLILLCLLLGTVITGNAQTRQTDTFKTRSGKEVTFTCIKHASILINYDGKTFYFDPVTGLKPETDYTSMPRANYIFITHEHADHFDRMALTQLVSSNTVVFSNPNVGRLYGNARVMKNGEKVVFGDSITLEAVPAYNTTPGREQMHPKGRDNGYILTLDGLRIYVAGDTEDIPEMADIKNIDIAFLPCNQPYTMTTDQLGRAAKTIRPKVLFPYHYNNTPVSRIKVQLSGSGIDVRIRNYQ
jgi:L-ascorbate metabolism protein UlaG (beta-lactamase superfamily)